ncbi:Prophage DNA-binding transcriptional regulator AlpA [Chromobacterium vaccinii]|nr:Prophage DNA-binding transcriptional regulator AlpA [Chromobacterium vaccinii]QND88651.1 Prophage DNA-binding transcriptional regulator AlpA [Chromobacterium vaccinii]
MTVKYIRPSQVAQRYTVARSTVYRWIKNDPSFPHPRKFGGITLFDLSELERWEAQRGSLAA